MTPTSIHSTCTCRFFHQGQCSCPDVTLFVIDDDSHAAGPFRLQQDGARMTFFYCLNGQARRPLMGRLSQKKSARETACFSA